MQKKAIAGNAGAGPTGVCEWILFWIWGVGDIPGGASETGSIGALLWAVGMFQCYDEEPTTSEPQSERVPQVAETFCRSKKN